MNCKKILNGKTYEDVKRYYSEKGVTNLSDESMKWISNFIEIIIRLTNFKLDYIEILKVNDHLDDVLRGHRPEIAISVKQNDSGRLLMGLMSDIKSTHRLNTDEKRWFAYCIIIRYYLRILDDETGEFYTGLVLFESVDKVKFEYNYEHGSHFFETVDNFPKYDKNQPFAYSIRNPITAVTVRDSAIYLRSLQIEGRKVTINRIGSMQGDFGELIDKYEVTITSDQSNDKNKYYLYVNEYGLENSNRPPAGFKFW